MFGENIPHCLASPDCKFCHINFKSHLFQSCFWFQQNFQSFGFTVGVCRKIDNSRTGSSFRYIILSVARNARNRKAFHVGVAGFSVAVNYIIYGAFVIPLENCYVKRILTDERLFGNFSYEIGSVTAEYDNIIYIRAITHIFIFFQSESHKALLAVNIKFFISHRNFCRHNIFKTPDFGSTLAPFAIFLFQIGEPLNGVGNNLLNILLDFFDFLFNGKNIFGSFVGIEFKDSRHADFHQPENIFTGDFPFKPGFPRL